MERIKQALEKARESTPSDTRSARERKPRGSRQDNYASDTPIAYSQTRVIEPRADALRRSKIVVGHSEPEISAVYKMLRTQVDQRLAAHDWNALAVTSPGDGEGKTVTAINLAVAMAKELHRTVLLVDADMRHPAVDQRFGFKADAGLVDYLLRDVPVQQLLVNPGIERLVILPAGAANTNSSELLASPKMARLVDEFKSRYPSRTIIFDLPPILATDDTLAFSPFVDATLLVIEDNATTKDDLRRAIEMLEGTYLLGTVLNKASVGDDAAHY